MVFCRFLEIVVVVAAAAAAAGGEFADCGIDYVVCSM